MSVCSDDEPICHYLPSHVPCLDTSSGNSKTTTEFRDRGLNGRCIGEPGTFPVERNDRPCDRICKPRSIDADCTCGGEHGETIT